jgi:hypothetical protein
MTETSPGSGGQRRARGGRMPRWVVVSLWVGAAVVVLALVAMVFGIGGEHGPGRHAGLVAPTGLSGLPVASAVGASAA